MPDANKNLMFSEDLVMISNLETKSSKKLSKELSDIFKNSIQEIEDLADKAPDQIVESVHLIRKKLKFLRAFAKLTQFCSEDHTYKPVNYILRDSGRAISDCRDAHVRNILLEEFAQTGSFRKLILDLKAFNNSIVEEIENSLLNGTSVFDELINKISDKQVSRYFKSLEPDAACLVSGLSLGYEKSYHAFHSELTSHEADLLHEWRKRTKDMQYHLEALLDSIPKPLTPSYDEVAELCEILGRINDLFMFIEWLNSLEDSLQADKQLTSLKDKLEGELKNLEDQADKLGHSLFTLTPEEYSQELSVHLEL